MDSLKAFATAGLRKGKSVVTVGWAWASWRAKQWQPEEEYRNKVLVKLGLNEDGSSVLSVQQQRAPPPSPHARAPGPLSSQRNLPA